MSGWLEDFTERKKKAVNEIFNIIETSDDPRMKREAFNALIQADIADLRRLELQYKRQDADDEKRLRLIEIIGRISPGDVGKLLSGGE